MTTPPDFDDDRYDEYKDDLVMGYIYPDGSQRDPDPPDDPRDEPWVQAHLDGPRTGDDSTDDPWALPEGETYDTEAPF